MDNEEDIEIEETEKVEKLVNIMLGLNLGIRKCDCVTVATKLIQLDLIKDIDE